MALHLNAREIKRTTYTGMPVRRLLTGGHYRQKHGMEVHRDGYWPAQWKCIEDHRIGGWRAVGRGAFQGGETGRSRRHKGIGRRPRCLADQRFGRCRLRDWEDRLSFQKGLHISHDLVFGVAKIG